MKFLHGKKKKERERIKAEIKRERGIKERALLELKSGPCVDCGIQYTPEVMDFDHVPGRGGKLGLVRLRPSLRAALEEASKCDVVCANCHRVRTKRRRQSDALVHRERANWLDGLAAAVERDREALRAVLERKT